MRHVWLMTLLTSTALAQDGGPRRRTISDVTLLLFTAPGCGSCKRFEAQGVLTTVQERLPRLRIEQIDLEKNTRYAIEVTPTLLLVDRDGFPLGRPLISLDDPSGTTERVEKLVRKMTGG